MDDHKSDRQIQQEVQRELQWDTRVEPAQIGVEVSDGVLTLNGTVSSWAKKIAAEEAAHRVHGVLDVANDINVRIPGANTHSDADIAAAVRHALQWDVFVPDEQIQSTVIDGALTLSGMVTAHAQRDDAAKAVHNLAGVRFVNNQIAVAGDQVTPDDLRATIHDALERHVDRETARIQIDVEGGKVTLRGKVQSWKERIAVLGAVTGTRGVAHVVDRLQIA